MSDPAGAPIAWPFLNNPLDRMITHKVAILTITWGTRPFALDIRKQVLDPCHLLPKLVILLCQHLISLLLIFKPFLAVCLDTQNLHLIFVLLILPCLYHLFLNFFEFHLHLCTTSLVALFDLQILLPLLG